MVYKLVRHPRGGPGPLFSGGLGGVTTTPLSRAGARRTKARPDAWSRRAVDYGDVDSGRVTFSGFESARADLHQLCRSVAVFSEDLFGHTNENDSCPHEDRSKDAANQLNLSAVVGVQASHKSDEAN